MRKQRKARLSNRYSLYAKYIRTSNPADAFSAKTALFY
ncbi:hypothetical protein LTSEINV_5063, partial [Salmonella enterica subsp. enterica serovar Inverness str. R8-3668]